MQLSKSEYMMFLKHPALLWLKKNDKANLPAVDANLQAKFDEGYAVEEWAQKLFPEGVTIGFSGYDSYLNMPERTQAALRSGKRVLHQARFEAGDLTCICDILVFDDSGKSLELYEVKGSTRAKAEHVHDLAFQQTVLTDAGYTVTKAAVVHINRPYVRAEEIVASELLAITDISGQVEADLPNTRTRIERALRVASTNAFPPMSPRYARMGGFYDWLEHFKKLTQPPADSIYDLCQLNAKLLGEIEDRGVKWLRDIPEDLELNERQLAQLKAVKTGERHVDIAKIKKFLKGLQYPLYFLDYETLGGSIPAFPGLHPYEQLPFQYSLHVLPSPGAPMRHYEYLHSDDKSPQKPISASLRENIGPVGTIITWNMRFEKGCNELLARLEPEYAQFMQDVNERVEDLMTSFAKNWYTDAGFLGSASIKKVLPVLAPQFSYKELAVGDGATAQRLWMRSVLEGDKTIDQVKLLADLRAYCQLDTLAMVEILNFLQLLVQTYK